MKKEEVVSVSKDRWQEAQEWEGNLWVQNNQRNGYLKVLLKFIRALAKPDLLLNYVKYGDFYCGDDWNYWWLKAFDNYKALPEHFEKAIEVGCGPFTNIRLISKISKIKEIYCTDPLINTYATFKLTWLKTQLKKHNIKISNDSCEKLNFPDNFCDLVVCINVLDHVRNATECLREMTRVIKRGGFLVLGQELSNEEDVKITAVRDDTGHPIKISQDTIDTFLTGGFESNFRKIMLREEGRNPMAHCGTYIFIGQKNDR